MSRKMLIAVAGVALLIVFAILLFRKNDGLSKVQRDIAESLDRAKVLKAERDSLRLANDKHRFPKREEEGEIEKTGKVEETVKKDPTAVVEEQSHVVTATVATKPATPGEGASIPAERCFTTSGMDGLTPKDKQSVFQPGAPVYIYAGVNVPQAEQIRIEWIDPAGKPIPPPDYVGVQTNTGPTGYRIYKFRTFQNAGTYEVRLYNAVGGLMASVPFEIRM